MLATSVLTQLTRLNSSAVYGVHGNLLIPVNGENGTLVFSDVI